MRLYATLCVLLLLACLLRDSEARPKKGGKRGNKKSKIGACLEQDMDGNTLAKSKCRRRSPCTLGPIEVNVNGSAHNIFFCENTRLTPRFVELQTIAGFTVEDVLAIQTVKKACRVGGAPGIACPSGCECTFGSVSISINDFVNEAFFCQNPASPTSNLLEVSRCAKSKPPPLADKPKAKPKDDIDEVNPAEDPEEPINVLAAEVEKKEEAEKEEVEEEKKKTEEAINLIGMIGKIAGRLTSDHEEMALAQK